MLHLGLVVFSVGSGLVLFLGQGDSRFPLPFGLSGVSARSLRRSPASSRFAPFVDATPMPEPMAGTACIGHRPDR